MMKDYYHDVLLPEVVRFAKIRAMNPEELDEFGAAIFATWYTQNPNDLPNREIICNFEEPNKEEPIFNRNKREQGFVGKLRLGSDTPATPPREPVYHRGVCFTAHTHPGEPLEPSPDDLLIYKRLRKILSSDPTKSYRPLVNYIIDGYTCRKVEEEEAKNIKFFNW